MTGARDVFDAIVIGAGAAGLMCAMIAGQRGRKVVVLEHTEKAGAKILISGGGRCNFTNLHVTHDNFLSENPQFCRPALSRYGPQDFIALVENHGIAYHEKGLGQLFCDGSAKSIVAMLMAECMAANVDVRLGQTVTSVLRRDDVFTAETIEGPISAPAVVLATGGLSIPKMGATGFSYDIARQFGLRVTETRPGLVPLRADVQSGLFDPALAGVSLDVMTSYEAAKFREGLLFTHRGFSGPAILQISSYWRAGEPISLDLLPGIDAGAALLERKRARPKAGSQTVLAELLPQRLAQALAAAHLPAGEIGNISDRALSQFSKQLANWSFQPTGTEGFAKAEVTAGGIDTHDLSSKTMEARSVPGLFAIGEAVDVTGWLGGYNFQWAWASGWCAGQAV